MIDIQDISKSFDHGRVPILKKVGFTVHDGELVALLGPSGSGKTTLLRIIAGLESADGGQILFDGHPPKPNGCANGKWDLFSSIMPYSAI
ncbi:MAG: ATP-binding cassette domain-containing protein [Rhodospirillaceae bacterium]|nr:ATP-binding cassette domain-containing protein [Rhodospirillaceae bacterium]